MAGDWEGRGFSPESEQEQLAPPLHEMDFTPNPWPSEAVKRADPRVMRAGELTLPLRSSTLKRVALNLF